MTDIYDLEIRAALSLAEAMDTVVGNCENLNGGDDCDCGGCLFYLSRFKRAGDDLHDWCMKLVLDDWRAQLKEKQKRRDETSRLKAELEED